MHLGNIQAQNEKEEPAIRALEKAVDTDPGNFAALMSLAVSYTNESYDQAAYQTLEKWITQRYPKLIGVQNGPKMGNPFELHSHVTDLFLTAARQAPAHGMDPDVQVGLGVLFYGSGDLDKAVDCFVSALNGRPNVSRVIGVSGWWRWGKQLLNDCLFPNRIISCGIDWVRPWLTMDDQKKPLMLTTRLWNFVPRLCAQDTI
jgi:tetratricopeptide (TPR) repeat protein